jgi:hypothetical protein
MESGQKETFVGCSRKSSSLGERGVVSVGGSVSQCCGAHCNGLIDLCGQWVSLDLTFERFESLYHTQREWSWWLSCHLQQQRCMSLSRGEVSHTQMCNTLTKWMAALYMLMFLEIYRCDFCRPILLSAEADHNQMASVIMADGLFYRQCYCMWLSDNWTENKP